MQLKNMPPSQVQNRWAYQLSHLQAALDRLDALHEEWSSTRDGLPAGARPGTPHFDDALAEHHAESWNYLDDWTTHGDVLREINTAALHTSSPLAPPPTATTTIDRSAPLVPALEARVHTPAARRDNPSTSPSALPQLPPRNSRSR